MCIINQRFRDKKPLSQKLIVKNSRFVSFEPAGGCVITDVFGTVLFEKQHLACFDKNSYLEKVEVDA